jgi:hypothetical protein
MKMPSPQTLDQQSVVYLSGYVDLGSERHHQLDENPALTKKWIAMLMKEPAYLHTDTLGRLWGQGKDDRWFPLHIECLGKCYGIRLPKLAAN